MSVRNTVLTALSLAAPIAITGCSGGGGGDSVPGGVAGFAPQITSSATVSIAENGAGVIYTVTATDADGDAITFALSGGPDAALFALNADTGALTLSAALDAERPTDADGDNAYGVDITASDGVLSATLNLTVTVTDAPQTGFAVERVGSGFSGTLYVTDARDGTGRVLVVERGGEVWFLDPETGLRDPVAFLDVSNDVSTDGERGLLGLALAPDFETSGVFFVCVTNLAGDTEIRRYQTGADGRVDPTSEDIILTVSQPASNHNGGWLDFSPADGFLYIGIGDGGGGGDPFGNGQDLDTLLGVVLRIDPDGDDFPGDDTRDYAVPADNPFVGTAGADEIYAYGLRNPFRASFNPVTSDVIMGDVGQDAFEEISVIPNGVAGVNFGWPRFEGSAVFDAGVAAPGAVDPRVEYAHSAGLGSSITGGYVYRGPVTALDGLYVFGDFVSGRVLSVPSTAVSASGSVTTAAGITDQSNAFDPDVGNINNLVSFGEGPFNDLYIVDFDGEIFRVVETE